MKDFIIVTIYIHWENQSGGENLTGGGGNPRLQNCTIKIVIQNKNFKNDTIGDMTNRYGFWLQSVDSKNMYII